MRPPHRILIIHPYQHVGGPDTFVTNIVRALTPLGYQFWVAMSGKRPLSDTLQSMGARVFDYPGLQTMPRSLSPSRMCVYLTTTYKVSGQLADLVRRESIHVTHAVHETMWTAQTRMPHGHVGRVASIHGLRFAEPAWAGWVNTRLLAHYNDRIICVSEAVRRILLGFGIPSSRLVMIPSSVDLDRFSLTTSGDEFRREIGIDLTTPLVGTVGSVDERKGIHNFIDACVRIREIAPKTRFVVIGDPGSKAPDPQGEYSRMLHKRATELGLDGCLQFLSPRPDIPQVMAALDILVQPSLTEAAPRAPLEAMAMARPVVGTRVGGMTEEVIDGETGILVQPADNDALADSVIFLLSDIEMRHKMGAAGRIRIEQYYSLARTADLLQQVYTAACAEIEA